MKWNKREKSIAVIYAIAAFVFILLTVLIPFSKPGASWVMFAFSLVSFGGGLGISLYAFAKSETLVSMFYGYPVFRIGFLYPAIQVALTFIIYIIGAFVNAPYWIGLLLSLLLLGAATIGVIAVDNARDYVEEIDTRTFVATKTLTKFKIDIADILDMCKNENVKQPLQKLVTKFRYSDPVSSPATEDKEHEIENELDKLRTLMSNDDEQAILDQITLINNLLSSRNRICEASK